MSPLLVQLHGSGATALSALFMLGGSLGLPVGGLMWTRQPQWARPGTAGALVLAAVLAALLPYAPAGAWPVMYITMGLLVGLWYPAWGAALFGQVDPSERGRVVGWAIALAYIPGQLSICLYRFSDPAWLTLGYAVAVALAAAVPVRASRPGWKPLGSGLLRPWRRLLLFALVAGPVVGVVRAVDAPALLVATKALDHVDLLFQASAAILAGVAIDRYGRIPTVVAAVMALGLSLGAGLVMDGAAAGVLVRFGARAGVAALEVFWATLLEDLSRAYGPAATFGFGHGLALLMVGVGVWAGQILPGLQTAGLAILALFALTGMLRGLPETRMASNRAHAVSQDLARALQLTTRRPLTPRETEVARLLLEGHTTSEIAVALFLTEHTVRAHLHRVYVKTGAGSRHELLSRVLRLVTDEQGAPGTFQVDNRR